MNNISKAIILATKAHDGQVDKGGNPYILHPLRVMLKMKSEEEKIVAVLHDVLEDTELNSKELLELGLSEDAVFAIECLTRHKDESYIEFIQRLKSVPVARSVKIADIMDNMNLSRIESPTEQDYIRNLKYQKALDELLSD
ncbi:GTP pyrophosphokinase [Paenibacillus sp. UMB4589-SE434]|uniref:GTP pyrophosphokinase n=1 Tax=Paenibacillus sp. UMB4589-SE434 TaxID=3046314 RepID=UPI00254E0B09|nr:GTP pyrophosphokinase [Paenibacillus sp. UMB4589-SE434]MDK8180608.1 GTP pyrophosphokinase [Paenibacillus sp. UMB4589-SE434]